MRALNHRQVLAFRAVMLSGSMTAAGRILHISQPAVTRLIRDLEEDLGLTLFNRKWASIQPTPNAVALFREVEKYFDAMERIRDSAHQLREKQEGRLRIAAMSTLSSGALPEAIRRFRAIQPGTGFFIHSDNSVYILNAMQRDEFSIGFGRVPAERTDINHTAMPTSSVVCLLPKTNPLANKKSISVEDLDGQPFISLGISSLLRMQIEDAMDEAGVRPGSTVQTLYSNTVSSYVAADLGIAVTDIFSVMGTNLTNIAVRPFTANIKFQFSAIFSSLEHTENSKLFAQIFNEIVAEQIINIEKTYTS